MRLQCVHYLVLGSLLTSICNALSTNNATAVCSEISKRISQASEVIYAGNADFASDIHHWFLSSTQIPTCVLEVGSDKDTAVALKIIAASRCPFAVESGGHTSNPGFSSTTGVHISLRRLQNIALSQDKTLVELGSGLAWSKVYSNLTGSGVNVVGGRVPGVGVSGLTLGGGFSWKTNQYGLACDNVHSYNLVLPNGTVTTVDSSNADLFFALKGGMNRFGIVTSAIYKTHPQVDQIYGGWNIYTPDATPAILNATETFYKTNTDPKAQIITTLSGSLVGTSALVLFFYDGPDGSASFAPFNSIIPLTLLQNVRTQSFSSFVSGIPSEIAFNARGTYNTLSTSKLTPGYLAAVKSEVDKYGKIMTSHSATTVSYDFEPFLPSYGKFATDSAYPHADSPLPLNLYFAWLSSSDDAFWYDQMRSSAQRLKDVAIKEGIYRKDYTKYPNYAISGTSATQLYGAANAERLEKIRSQVDPDRVMELAGGFTI